MVLRITVLLFMKLLPLKRSDTLLSFFMSLLEAELDILNMKKKIF